MNPGQQPQARGDDRLDQNDPDVRQSRNDPDLQQSKNDPDVQQSKTTERSRPQQPKRKSGRVTTLHVQANTGTGYVTEVSSSETLHSRRWMPTS